MPGEYPEALENLAQALGRLPGIGKRTAERLALALLDWEADDLADFGDQLIHLRERVLICETCGNLSDQAECRICRDPRRDQHLICIVEQARQVPVIEKCGHYRGLYHVLGGKLSPLDGIGGEDLNLASLYTRVASLDISEVILSTSPDVEGEATAAYIAAELRRRFEVSVTRIASGIPVGADLSFTDAATMAMAMDSRRSM